MAGRSGRKVLGVLDAHSPPMIGETSSTVGNQKRVPVKMRRLNLNLPEPLYCDLEDLAAATGKTMTDIIKAGLGLANLVYRDIADHERLAVADSNGRVVKEIHIIA